LLPLANNYCRLSKRSEGQRIIIIDTMRRFHSADENSSSAMATLIAVLEEIAHKTGAAVLFLHHTNKAALGGDGDNQGASRGSSVLVDNARYVLNASVMPKPLGRGENRHNGQLISENARKYYLRLNDSKINNAAKNDETWLFRRPGGVLIKANFTEALEFPFLIDKSNLSASATSASNPAPIPVKKSASKANKVGDNDIANLFS